MAGKRTHPVFELAISQSDLKLEVVTDKGIGKLIRLVAASKLEEIGEVVNNPRRKFRHVCGTPVFYSGKFYLLRSALRSPMTRVVCLITISKNFSVSNRKCIFQDVSCPSTSASSFLCRSSWFSKNEA
jgi:hypothetical protein